MNVYYIFKRIPHHSGHSGYDQLVKYAPGKCLGQTSSMVIKKMLDLVPERRLRRWTWVGGWYRNESLAKELQIMLNLPFRKGLYNYLYGEDDFHWGGSLPFRSGSKIVVTYHQPPSEFDKVMQDKSFVSRADAIIVCGSNQTDYFEKITGRKNVFFVPHGVDTMFFTPAVSKKEGRGFNTISVGWWLRDVDMIKRIIERANEKTMGIEFNIVTFPEYFDFYRGLDNVNLFSGLTDEELKRKYQEADALLLPMKDCTANNAVLEALACGLPVLTTDNGGMRDYVDEDCGYFAKPGNEQALADALAELMADPEKRLRMADAARQQAMKFDWKIVGQQIMAVYERIWTL